MRDYKSLEKKLTCLTDYFAEKAFDDTGFRDVRELIEQHGEYGEAYYLLCHLIVQNQLAIPNDMYQKVVELGKEMELDQDVWLSLAGLIKVS